MIIVSICGASGSGKTCLARNLSTNLMQAGFSARVLTVDSYYICHPEMTFSQRTKLNYDAPEAFDFDTLKSDINLLKSGKPITTKLYDYAVHLRNDTNDLIYPPDVLLIEGIHSFANTEILAMSDIRLFVDTDPDVCIVRRMCRDTQKRDRSVQAIAEQYLDTVKPMYDKYIRFYRNNADLCVVGGGKNARAINIVSHYIMSLIRNQ